MSHVVTLGPLLYEKFVYWYNCYNKSRTEKAQIKYEPVSIT